MFATKGMIADAIHLNSAEAKKGNQGLKRLKSASWQTLISRACSSHKLTKVEELMQHEPLQRLLHTKRSEFVLACPSCQLSKEQGNKPYSATLT